jgi:MFS family permease
MFFHIGTHLYVLYEGYGYSVASLYCLGFVTGAVTSPITGALVDKIGRKKAALLYCALEIFINMLEQYPILAGLIVSRMIGGITTNLLSTVFETWLDAEYRGRGFEKKEYEIIMRDSVVASNLAAIASGLLAHQLAERFGPVGPFEGAVACTAVAFVIVMVAWTENYGSLQPGVKSVSNYLTEAVETFKSDSKVLRVGIIQGLTMGSLQIFVFLWSPALRELARNSAEGVLGLDSQGEPAYGLIFGAFMAAGVIGGSVSSLVRKAVTLLLSPLAKSCNDNVTVTIEGEGEIRPMAVEFLAAFCYLICSCLLLAPCLVSSDGVFSFSILLVAFLMYEFMIGVYMPCEGVIRSLYIPSDARCSMMTFPRIIVNVAVSLGVISTRFAS